MSDYGYAEFHTGILPFALYAHRLVSLGRPFQRVEVDQRFVFRSRSVQARARLTLERIDDAEFLGDLTHGGQHLLPEKTRAGHALLQRERSLRLEKPEDPRMEHFHYEAQLRQYRLRSSDDDLQSVLCFLVIAVNFAPGFLNTHFTTTQA